MAKILDFMSASLLKEITTDIAHMLGDTDITISITYHDTGSVSFNILGSITEINGTTIVLPAILGGYGDLNRMGYTERERTPYGSELPVEGMYFIVRRLAVTDPDVIDNLTYDGRNYRVTTINQDTIGSHYRIGVVRT